MVGKNNEFKPHEKTTDRQEEDTCQLSQVILKGIIIFKEHENK